jgi:hypothetical protein
MQMAAHDKAVWKSGVVKRGCEKATHHQFMQSAGETGEMETGNRGVEKGGQRSIPEGS